MSNKSNANAVQHGEWCGEEQGSRRGRGRAGEWRVKGSGGARRRLSLTMTWAVAARKYVWLWDHLHRMSPAVAQ